jgi:membrane protein required for colicin V production
VIGWAFLGWLLQGKEPEWAASSRTRPAMENTRDNIIAMLPENAEALLQRLRNKEAPTEAEPAEPDPQRPAAPGAPAAPQPPQRRS